MDPYHETYQGNPEPQPETHEIPITRLIQLEKQHREGANWFYWIAGLSGLSSILLVIGSPVVSAVSLGSTQLLAAFGQQIPGLTIPAIIASVLILGVFALFGYLSNIGKRGAYLIGIILFFLDTLITLWAEDFIGFAFHCLALYFMIVGVIALFKLKKLLPKSASEENSL